jgi:hypothetical protein
MSPITQSLRCRTKRSEAPLWERFPRRSRQPGDAGCSKNRLLISCFKAPLGAAAEAARHWPRASTLTMDKNLFSMSAFN